MTTEYLNKITLIHGDCMDYMRTLPDNAFEVAIVDPPYGDAGIEPDDTRGLRFHGGQRWDRYDRFNGSCFKRYHKDVEDKECGHPRKFSVAQWDTAPDEEYFKELFRVSRNQIIWGANYFPNMPPTRCFIVWRKLTISESFSMAMAEYAWTSFNQNAKVFECAPQGTAKFPRFHPTQKPVELYAWLLTNFAKEGDKILDTHGGSMSHAIAAHNLGFELTIIEKDDAYYAKARERLIKHQQQLTLF